MILQLVARLCYRSCVQSFSIISGHLNCFLVSIGVSSPINGMIALNVCLSFIFGPLHLVVSIPQWFPNGFLGRIHTEPGYEFVSVNILIKLDATLVCRSTIVSG